MDPVPKGTKYGNSGLVQDAVLVFSLRAPALLVCSPAQHCTTAWHACRALSLSAGIWQPQACSMPWPARYKSPEAGQNQHLNPPSTTAAHAQDPAHRCCLLHALQALLNLSSWAAWEVASVAHKPPIL